MKSRLVIQTTLSLLISVNALAIDCKPPSTGQFAQSGQLYTPDISTVVNTASEIRIEESLRNDFRKIEKSVTWRRGERLPVFYHLSSSYLTVYHRVTALFPDGSGLGGCTWTGKVVITEGDAERAAYARAIVPVVGSVAGANNSRFRTAITLFNTTDYDTQRGRIVFHPAGRGGSSSDPSISYALEPGQHIEYSDIVEAIGTSGLGSLDIVPTDSLYTPAAHVTIYNDAGNGASFGMSVPLIRAADLEVENFVGASAHEFHVIVPAQTEKRLNLGVRSGANGGNFTAIVRRADGSKVMVERDYPADYFIQSSVNDFLGVPVAAGDQILFWSLGAVVYATETNNATNDPQMIIPFTNLSDYFVGNYFR